MVIVNPILWNSTEWHNFYEYYKDEFLQSPETWENFMKIRYNEHGINFNRDCTAHFEHEEDYINFILKWQQ